jgi:peptide/nickel transport system substrate-binding protein
LITAGVLALMSVASAPVLAAEAPAGQMSWALHFSLAPTRFEPAETAGLITPFMILYALHDALVKPMPGKTMAPSLAESWSTSSDGLVYEFVLRNAVGIKTRLRPLERAGFLKAYQEKKLKTK